MRLYEVINVTYYNPKDCHIFKVDRSERERVHYYRCSNKENCELYKNGTCVLLGYDGLISHSKCPYGYVEEIVGKTKSAKSCGDLSRQAKTEFEDFLYKLKEPKSFGIVGDYIYFPIIYIKNYNNTFAKETEDFYYENSSKLINKKYYTKETFKRLCEYRPMSLMSGIIKDYRKKVLPMFLRKLRTYDIKMFTSLCEIYPDANKIVEEVSFIGKNAKLKTLKNGTVKAGSYKCEWDGEKLIFIDDIYVYNLKGKFYCLPSDEAVVEVVDNETVCDETIFI